MRSYLLFLSLLMTPNLIFSESLGGLESLQKQSADAIKNARSTSEDLMALDFLAGKIRQGVWKPSNYPDLANPESLEVKPRFKYEKCVTVEHSEIVGDGTVNLDNNCNQNVTFFGSKTIDKPSEMQGLQTKVRVRGFVDDDLLIQGTPVKNGCPGSGRLPNNAISTFVLAAQTESFSIQGKDTKGGAAAYNLEICFEPVDSTSAAQTLVPLREMIKKKRNPTSPNCDVPSLQTAFQLPLDSNEFCENDLSATRRFFIDPSKVGALGVPSEKHGSFAYLSVPFKFPENYFTDPNIQISPDLSFLTSKRVEFIRWIPDLSGSPLRAKAVLAKVGGAIAEISFSDSLPSVSPPEDPIKPLCELRGPEELVRSNTPFSLELMVRGVVHTAQIKDVAGGEVDLDKINLELPYDDDVIHTVQLTAPSDEFDEAPIRGSGTDQHFVFGTKTYRAAVTGVDSISGPYFCTKTIRVKKYDPLPSCNLECAGSQVECQEGFFGEDPIPLKLTANEVVVSGNLNEMTDFTTDQISAAKTSTGALFTNTKEGDSEEQFFATVLSEAGDDGIQNEGFCQVNIGGTNDDPCTCPDNTQLAGELCPFGDASRCDNENNFCPFLDPNYKKQVTLSRYDKDDYEVIPIPTANSVTGAPEGLDSDCNPRARTWRNYSTPPARPRANASTGEPGSYDTSCIPEVATWKVANSQCTANPLPFYQRKRGNKCQIAKTFRCKVTSESCMKAITNADSRWVRARGGRCQVASSFGCFPKKRLKANAQTAEFTRNGKPLTMWFQDTRKVIPLADGSFKKHNPGRGPKRRHNNLTLWGGGVDVHIKSSFGNDVHFTQICNGHVFPSGDGRQNLTADQVLCAVEREPTGAKYSPEFYWAVIGPINDPDCEVLDSKKSLYTRVGGCFTADTPITMANGKEKLVSEIRENEYVFNPHYRTGIRVKKVVKGPEPKPLFEVALNGKKIKVTEDHPFFTERGWVQTLALKKGDKLFGEGKGKVVESVRKLPYKKPVDVWNFELDTEDPLAHIVMANGVPTGDLVTQLELKKPARKLP